MWAEPPASPAALCPMSSITLSWCGPTCSERVKAAAQQLGYDGPDPRGRVLRDGKFNAIGFMPPGDYAIAEMVRSPYGRELVLGASLACDEAGATLSLVNGTDETRTSTIREALVDGFILGHSADIELIASAQRRRLPFVILESEAGPAVNSIRIDGRSGALMAVRHLTALGHRHFAILSVRRTYGPPIVHMPGRVKRAIKAGFQLDHERLEGFAQGLAEVGLSIDDVAIIETTPGDQSAGAVVFDRVPEATAILTMSDWQAITVLNEAASSRHKHTRACVGGGLRWHCGIRTHGASPHDRCARHCRERAACCRDGVCEWSPTANRYAGRARGPWINGAAAQVNSPRKATKRSMVSAPLPLPFTRQSAHQRLKLNCPRLLAVEDRVDQIRREQRQSQRVRDERPVEFFGCCKFNDRRKLTRVQLVLPVEGLDDGSHQRVVECAGEKVPMARRRPATHDDRHTC